MKGKSGRFANTIFYFLRADKKNDCTVVVTGKAINRGDGRRDASAMHTELQGTQKMDWHFKEGVNRQRLMQSEIRTGLTSRILGWLKINSMFCSTKQLDYELEISIAW